MTGYELYKSFTFENDRYTYDIFTWIDSNYQERMVEVTGKGYDNLCLVQPSLLASAVFPSIDIYLYIIV